MAERDRKQAGIQDPQDYYRSGAGPRHQAQEKDGQRRAGTRTPAPGEDRQQELHPHTIDPTERTPGAILDELPDGDGPRSDAGTNPLPDVYWAAYPGQKPDEE
ncbi:hypothetical protein [Pyxidicoccus xibeiensis]|uniref:hypothetical protein n=1 Tax=Pyxidicoccus xibeiensis TaxID=2906759 RepID=UPI0020A7810D|nr:hypothetical protein [Pyxidicoccus xibeiensis]MCP3138249.1 hypothetical protein [Pyxidicoccus xibeiensis]